MWSNTPLIEQKRSLYTNSRLDLDTFTSADQFTAAIDTIDTALCLILHTKEKLSKKSSIDAVQLACVKELESLKQTIINHPNYTIFQEAKKQEALQHEIEEQWWVIENDEQFMAWLWSIIPKDNLKLRNTEVFKKKFLERIFKIGSFEEEIMYGQYETHISNKTILGVLDMTEKWKAFIIILNIPYGYEASNLHIYKLPTVYTTNKPPIKPSVVLADSYINPQQVAATQNTPSS
jgi:hypothetical protein